MIETTLKAEVRTASASPPPWAARQATTATMQTRTMARKVRTWESRHNSSGAPRTACK
jgi:hypothetical protein